MERLFNYRPEGQTITTNSGNKEIMIIRRGPRGIVSVIKNEGPIIIWSDEEADNHINDTEEQLIQKTIDMING